MGDLARTAEKKTIFYTAPLKHGAMSYTQSHKTVLIH